MRRKIGWNWLIIICAIALVVVPIASSIFSDEAAKWHLAAAANASQIGLGSFDDSLAAAEKATTDIAALHDYWVLKVIDALTKEPASIPRILEEAREKDSHFLDLAAFAMGRLEQRSEFALVTEVQEMYFSPAARNTPPVLNNLAYMRALAGIELDQALSDIDRALEYYPNDAGLRDTRAWVLFQMGRTIEALEDAEFAVAKTEEIDGSSVTGWLGKLEEALRPGFDDSGDPEATQSRLEAGESLWNEGVLRYHRGKILEALGRQEEAEEDFAWIKLQRLPLGDALH